MVTFESFDSFLDAKVDVQTEYWETSAYIKSVMQKYLHADNDMSDQSVVLLWFDAKQKMDFEKFQDIGDWVFYSSVWFPGSIRCDQDFYESIGRSAYYKCYRFLKGAWPLYEEMADKFHSLVNQVVESAGIEPTGTPSSLCRFTRDDTQ